MGSTGPTWDPSLYARYAGERARPFLDLLARVTIEPHAAADLGCGPGDMTRLLADRWPDAELSAVDNSPEMLAKARAALPARVQVIEADVAAWSPPSSLDLIFSNATLHWVPDHEILIPRLASFVAPGGALAVQMPSNHDAPSHRAIRDVAGRTRWRDRLEGLAAPSAHVLPLAWYANTLDRLGFDVDGWETTYLHRLVGDDPVLEWVKGTALRPFLDRLSERLSDRVSDRGDAEAFLAELGTELRAAYPVEAGRALFPFSRRFFVATRGVA